MHDVCAHGRRGGLAVGTGYAECAQLARDGAEHLCALLYLEAVLAEVHQLLVVGGDGGGVDDETRLRLLAGMWKGVAAARPWLVSLGVRLRGHIPRRYSVGCWCCPIFHQ